MILKTTWINCEHFEHPELSGVQPTEKLLALNFIEETSIDAVTEKAIRMRSLEMFQEPYDPPEYL